MLNENHDDKTIFARKVGGLLQGSTEPLTLLYVLYLLGKVNMVLNLML